MIQTKVFKFNQSQAVRLPKAVAFPEGVKEVEIVVVGNSRIVTPITIKRVTSPMTSPMTFKGTKLRG